MSDRVTITMSDGTTREIHPDTPVGLEGGGDRTWPALDVDYGLGDVVTTVFEPTREHWTPYEPWMRDVLAGDARVSYLLKFTSAAEKREPWGRVEKGSPLEEAPSDYDLRVHPDDVPERPAEDDPDEALAVVIDELVDDHGGTSEWADNEYITRSTALAIARAAREHIAREQEDALVDSSQQVRAEKAEAERDEAKARHKALRANVERLSNSWEDFDEPAPWRSPSYFAALNRCAYEARALLNPPTEGGESDA